MTRLCELVDSPDRDTALAARVLRAYGPTQVSWARRQRVRSALASRRGPAHGALRYPLLACVGAIAVLLIVVRLDPRKAPSAPGSNPQQAPDTEAPLVEQQAIPDRGGASADATTPHHAAPAPAGSLDAHDGAGRHDRATSTASAAFEGSRPGAATGSAAAAVHAPAVEPGHADEGQVAAEAHPGAARATVAPWAPADRAPQTDTNGRLAGGAPTSPTTADNQGGDAHGANPADPMVTAVGSAGPPSPPWMEPRQPPQLRSAPPRGDRKRPSDDGARPVPTGGPGRQNFEPAHFGGPGPARDDGPVAIAFADPLGDADLHGTIHLERPEGGTYVAEVEWHDSDGNPVTSSVHGSTDSDVDVGVDLDGDGQEDVIVAPEDCPPVYASSRTSTIASAIAAPICVYLRRQQQQK